MTRRNLFLLFAIILTGSLTAFGQTDIAQPDFFQSVLSFVKENWIFLLTGVYELITRAVPNWESKSLLRFIVTLIDVLIPDRKADNKLHSASLNVRKETVPTFGQWLIRLIPAMIVIPLIIYLYINNVFGSYLPIAIIGLLVIAFLGLNGYKR